jgi:hypothetical protein
MVFLRLRAERWHAEFVGLCALQVTEFFLPAELRLSLILVSHFSVQQNERVVRFMQ